jgi:hypothetical protein
MSQKTITCKNCNQGGLFWRQSAKGNWYLCDPAPIQTSTLNNKWIPFAHKCAIDSDGNTIKQINGERIHELMLADGYELVGNTWIKKASN